MAFHGICSNLALKITVNGVKKPRKKAAAASTPPVIDPIDLSMLLAVGKVPQKATVKTAQKAKSEPKPVKKPVEAKQAEKPKKAPVVEKTITLLSKNRVACKVKESVLLNLLSEMDTKGIGILTQDNKVETFKFSEIFKFLPPKATV